MKIFSPVTQSQNIEHLDKISKESIIRHYANDLDIDVSRFFLNIDSVQIIRCLDTGYLFYYPFDIYGDEKFYDELKIQLPVKYNSPYYSSWKWEYEVCSDFIKVSDKVFEIGCGFGDFLLKLKSKATLHVSGIELNQDSVYQCRKKGLDVENAFIEDKAKEVEEEFDVVCSFQVLEHVTNIKSFLDASIKVLKKGGLLMIAVPFNDPFLFKNDKFNTLNMPPHHMGLWGKKAFENLSNFFPIEVEHIIIEKLPSSGYDFDQYYSVNKDINFRSTFVFKKMYDKLFYKWLKRNHSMKNGKNMIAIYRKR